MSTQTVYLDNATVETIHISEILPGEVADLFSRGCRRSLPMRRGFTALAHVDATDRIVAVDVSGPCTQEDLDAATSDSLEYLHFGLAAGMFSPAWGKL